GGRGFGAGAAARAAPAGSGPSRAAAEGRLRARAAGRRQGEGEGEVGACRRTEHRRLPVHADAPGRARRAVPRPPRRRAAPRVSLLARGGGPEGLPLGGWRPSVGPGAWPGTRRPDRHSGTDKRRYPMARALAALTLVLAACSSSSSVADAQQVLGDRGAFIDDREAALDAL